MMYRLDGLRLHSKLNQRVHWATKAKQAKIERHAAYYTVKPHALPCTVTLTRIGPRELDGDNLQGSCKGVRDGVADRLGVDDRSPLITWIYQQRKEKVYAVEIVIAN